VDAALTRTGTPAQVAFMSFKIDTDRVVDDPRCNGKSDYWVVAASETMGRRNDAQVTAAPAALAPYVGQVASQPWKWSPDTNPNHLRGGLPIIVRNGPMRNIGELGYIFLSNRENDAGTPQYKWFWGTIDLMHYDEGAYLLDHLTARSTNIPVRGLVSISSKQEDVLKALLNGAPIGYDTTTKKPAVLDRDRFPSIGPAVDDLVNAILNREQGGKNFVSFQDLFDGEGAGSPGPGGMVADKFRELGRAVWTANGFSAGTVSDAVREDAFRNMLDLITFRQNIFTIVLAAQVLAPDEITPIAEKRAVATVYRDAYTGNSFVRSFKWLSD